MAKFDRSVAPYYDDYDSSKQYTHLLALPGRVAQAREITQIQSTVKDIIKSIGDSIMKDGDTIEGCQVILNKYSIGEVSQSISKNTDRVALSRSDITGIHSVTQEGKSFKVGTNDSDGDCYLLVDNGTYYIKWNGTSNHPVLGTPYKVIYRYNVSDVSKSATVTAGRVYLNGMVLPVEETTINIKGVYDESTEYIETIGFRLNETLITEAEDPSLRDPAIGYENQNQAGCYRIKSSVSIVLNDPDSAILSKLINGEISVEKYAPEYDTITQNLATRTKEESGSYTVRGLGVRVEDNKADDSKINVVVEAGIAYINGYRRELKSSRKIPLDRSLEYKQIERNTVYNDRDYTLSTTGESIKEILRVEGIVQSSNIQMSAPTTNTSTQIIVLPSDAIEFFNIVSVKYGGTTYTEGTDYDIEQNGTQASIRWKGTSNYPAGSYMIVCRYRALFSQGTDYELTSVNGLHTLHWMPEGKKPISGLSLRIVFNLYLARKDIVHINQDGDISIIKGTPAEYGTETLPENNIETLVLAHILHSPGSDYDSGIIVSNIALTRFTMNDIQNLLNRIRALEYNQTISTLQEDTKQRTVGGSRKSIFTDPLIDFSKVDYYYNLVDGIVSNPRLPYYDATIDFSNNLCYLPTKTKTYDLAYDDYSSNIKKYNRVATLGKSGESVVLSQMNATRTFLVNPYSKFPQLPEINLTPAVDSWIEDKFIEVPVSQTSSSIISSSTRHIESTSVLAGRFATYTVSSSSYSDTAIGTKVSTKTQESVINERAATYIRSKEIIVEGSNFPANLDNIRCYFEGVQLPIYPTGSTRASTETTSSGAVPSVRASSDGTLTARFTIPEDTFLTGIREVRLETAIPGYESEGVTYALYQATGTNRTVQRTVETITTVLLHRVTTVNSTTYIDPVGQTFVLDKMTLISGIDVYFAAAPVSGDTPVICDIREVVNGNITSTILGHKSLKASEVRPTVSEDSSRATRFVFDDPVLLEANKEYAFVIRSTSTDYRIWVADLGENDIITKNPVLTNPYLIGVMMSSSNNSSWTTHQTSDIKFRLISDTYNKSSDLVFSQVRTSDPYSRLYLISESIIPEGTTIDWYYSTDSGRNFYPISPYQIKLLESMYSDVTIKATLSREDRAGDSISPLIALDSVSVVASSYDNSGCYLSVEYPGNNYNRVDIILDTYTPGGTSISVYVSADNGVTLVPANVTDSTSLNYGWIENTYSATMNSQYNQCKIIIKLSSDNNHTTPAFRGLRAITYTV